MIKFSFNQISFIADERGIKDLKKDFLLSQPKFFYLRKGEDIGANDIAILYAQATLFFTALAALYPIAKDIYKSIKKWIEEIKDDENYKIKDYRILCTKNKLTLRAEKFNSYLGVKVKFRKLAPSDSLRFYLTNKQYALFLRHNKGKKALFIGHIGSDPKIINELKSMFLKEWKESL